MAVENEDLGLSLSLNFSGVGGGSSGGGSRNGGGCSNRNQSSGFQLNLMPSLVSSPSSTHSPPQPVAMATALPNSAPNLHFLSHLHKSPWTDSALFPSSDRNSDMFRGSGCESRTFLRGIDVNRLPATADEEDVGVSSPNSTVSSISGKRSEREATNGSSEDNETERACSRGMSDEEDGDNSRKKLRLSKDQSAILEESFKEHNTLNPKQKLALAKRLGLRPRQVEVWFQNRRARTKLKQTEVDCEFLKKCCEQLTEENRRLQKEVQELRALKLSPQFYMQMTPPTTLTMCPSCEKVAAPPSSASSASAQHHHQQQHTNPSSVAAAAHHHLSHPHRSMPLNPWVGAPVPIRSFDALQPRS